MPMRRLRESPYFRRPPEGAVTTSEAYFGVVTEGVTAGIFRYSLASLSEGGAARPLSRARGGRSHLNLASSSGRWTVVRGLPRRQDGRSKSGAAPIGRRAAFLIVASSSGASKCFLNFQIPHFGLLFGELSSCPQLVAAGWLGG